jgi:hypothetical protein
MGANPIFPPEVQIPRVFFLPGNCRTINTYTLLINLARIFSPLLAVPTNIFNPGAWLGAVNSGGLAGFDPLGWPLQVAFVNPILDQSRFSFLASRWTDTHTVTKDINKDAGCIWRAYTWLEEDVDSPHQELSSLANTISGFAGSLLGEEIGEVTDKVVSGLIRPHRNCVVFANENVSGVGGPTGTAFDGVINLVGATADDFITETLFNVDRDGDGVTDPLFRKWLAVAPKPPDVVFRDTEFSGIIDSQRSMHKLTARTIMIGGKSPAWVNQLITFGIKFALSQIQIVITEGLFANTGQAPIGSGLEEIYQGQLDDTLLAYQRFTDPVRVLRGGQLGFQENFEQAGGTAYTTSGILNIRQGHWKSRAFQSFKVTVRNGSPWLYGYDFVLGERLGFEIGAVCRRIVARTVDGRDVDRDEPARRRLSVPAERQGRPDGHAVSDPLGGLPPGSLWVAAR